MPLELVRGRVKPDWIDYNGHMNVAYYVLAFDEATDRLFDLAGLDAAYRAARGLSTFAVESHVNYYRELIADTLYRIESQLLAFDDKRLRFFHWMYHAEENFLVATSEWLGLHVDLESRRVVPFPSEIKARLTGLLGEKGAALPPQAGRGISRPQLAVTDG